MTYLEALAATRAAVTDPTTPTLDVVRDALEVIAAGRRVHRDGSGDDDQWSRLSLGVYSVIWELHHRVEPVTAEFDPDDDICLPATADLVEAIAERLDQLSSIQEPGSAEAWLWATHAADLRIGLRPPA